ncbi:MULTISPECIES: GNAT family N-acetyltransferase [unclassified Acinetobacter]|uniref:GNAT family N-acetyltransferase n=2 Tax=Acinetobacter TaxID=469 RepID=UPI0015D1361B|nr:MULTISPECIES: GNAT family N-acetyltransferase [unclassified Acinetobacter]
MLKDEGMQQLNIQFGPWEQLASAARPIREQVFILEQQISPEDEWDAEDEISLHFIVHDGIKAVATARLLKNNSIGRVAVLKAYRGQGVGKFLMQAIIEQAKLEQREYLKLSSQVHAIAFYAALGFVVEGDEYLDCGIQHQDMYMALA